LGCAPEPSVLEIPHRLENLLLRIHDARAVLGDGFLQGTAGDEQQLGVFARRDVYAVRRGIVYQESHALCWHALH